MLQFKPTSIWTIFCCVALSLSMEVPAEEDVLSLSIPDLLNVDSIRKQQQSKADIYDIPFTNLPLKFTDTLEIKFDFQVTSYYIKPYGGPGSGQILIKPIVRVFDFGGTLEAENRLSMFITFGSMSGDVNLQFRSAVSPDSDSVKTIVPTGIEHKIPDRAGNFIGDNEQHHVEMKLGEFSEYDDRKYASVTITMDGRVLTNEKIGEIEIEIPSGESVPFWLLRSKSGDQPNFSVSNLSIKCLKTKQVVQDTTKDGEYSAPRRLVYH